ncbi:sensor histidine kinase [Paenibacillus sp. FSL R10-2782]|uniref:sensor histidine kinase n=1 Tax=Paenibacillus sp. FSL R10-2782 TaxID=2954661 RepID=UPI0031595593
MIITLRNLCKRIRALDNWRLKTKLYVLFVFCVLIPVIATNLLFYQSIKGSIEQKEYTNSNQSLQRIKFNLRNNIDNSLYVSNFLYTDEILNRFMDSVYHNEEDYYQAYYNMLSNNNIFRYYYSYQNVNQITFYVDNETIVNGGNFIKLDDTIRKTEWYQALTNTKDHIMIYSYFDKQQAQMSQSQGGRKVSIIRKFDYFGDNQVEKILKVDLDYNFINKSLRNESMDGKMYVVANDKVIFSNDQKINNNQKSFYSIANCDIFPVQRTEVISMVSEDWKIIVSMERLNILSEVLNSKVNFVIMIVLNLLLPTMLIWMISRSLITRVEMISKHLDKVKQEKFEVIVCPEGKDEIGNLIRSYNMMVTKIKDLILIVYKDQVEKQALELSKKQAELKALQSQVNPHFMFNTLETIRMRSLIKNEIETSEIIKKLSLLLRKTINWGDDLISIREEIKFVESYLNIQQYRFGDKLQYEIQVLDEQLLDLQIPKLTILTFVENACIHGIESTSQDGSVTVKFDVMNKHLYMTIQDTGAGMDERKLEYIRNIMRNPSIDRMSELDSIGMLNAYIRLRIYFDERVNIRISSEMGKGTVIEIRVPL